MNPNWKKIAREHLSVLRLPAEREIEIVEELAQHLEAAYEDSLTDGLSETEAEARTVQSYDWRLLECELSRAEQPLAQRALQPSLKLIERKGYCYHLYFSRAFWASSRVRNLNTPRG